MVVVVVMIDMIMYLEKKGVDDIVLNTIAYCKKILIYIQNAVNVQSKNRFVNLFISLVHYFFMLIWLISIQQYFVHIYSSVSEFECDIIYQRRPYNS